MTPPGAPQDVSEARGHDPGGVGHVLGHVYAETRRVAWNGDAEV